jgi:hypothetical protein
VETNAAPQDSLEVMPATRPPYPSGRARARARLRLGTTPRSCNPYHLNMSNVNVTPRTRLTTLLAILTKTLLYSARTGMSTSLVLSSTCGLAVASEVPVSKLHFHTEPQTHTSTRELRGGSPGVEAALSH